VSRLCKGAPHGPLRRIGLTTAASLGVLIGAPIPLASAQIVVGKGIASVRIGDSTSQVTKLLGTPSTSPYTSHGEWLYNAPLNGIVGFRAGTEGHEHITTDVTYVETASHRQRTGAGVGPGSSSSQFHGAYRGYRCDHLNGASSGLRACWTTTRSRGQTVTTAFYFAGGPKVVFVVDAGHSFQLRAQLAL
jgi:hypothetical protein